MSDFMRRFVDVVASDRAALLAIIARHRPQDCGTCGGPVGESPFQYGIVVLDDVTIVTAICRRCGSQAMTHATIDMAVSGDAPTTVGARILDRVAEACGIPSAKEPDPADAS